MIALLALSGFATLIALYDLQFVSFAPMPWPEIVPLSSRLRQSNTAG